jgi:exodeoxyribonuclease V alpha subunit
MVDFCGCGRRLRGVGSRSRGVCSKCNQKVVQANYRRRLSLGEKFEVLTKGIEAMVMATLNRSGRRFCGRISRVVYRNEQNGYVVLAVDDTENFRSETATGTMPDPKEGLTVEFDGEWKVNPKYPDRGLQFNFSSYRIPEPVGSEAVQAFLATLDGLGESKAAKVVERFGVDSLKVLAETPRKLLEISGIGEKTLRKISQSYEESRGLQELIMFLHGVGVSAGYAKGIYKQYGKDAERQIRQNPYILIEEVRGFGFKRADEIARGLGIKPDSQMRFDACIKHVMQGSANLKGHCYLPVDELLTLVCDTMALPDYQPQLSDADSAVKSLKKVSINKSMRLVEEDGSIYLWSMHDAEVQLAEKLRLLAGELERSKDEDISEWISEYEARQGSGFKLAAQQREAVAVSAANGLTIITGGPGVGKSTVARAIVELWHKKQKRIVAIAPTGKAAQRIREATGLRDAQTIHRVLGWKGDGFGFDSSNPLAGDAFLIDEASMVDLKLANSLFRAIPRHATVVVIGDVDQLPSVGAGNVLRDMILSEVIPVVRLTEVQRQASHSRIIQAAREVNRGEFPTLEQVGRGSTPTTDALWVKCSSEQIPAAIRWLVSEFLPGDGRWQRGDVQCLAPMHKTDSGNIALNALVQECWNQNPQIPWMGSLKEGDRIIQLKNDYERMVFNGDIGEIVSTDGEEKTGLVIMPDMDDPAGRLVEYKKTDFDDTQLGYSISIHKSQGCEFPVVIIPATMQHFMMLQRNLFYTGMTRAKKLLIFVGEEKAIAQAVRTNKVGDRNTGLMQRLKG